MPAKMGLPVNSITAQLGSMSIGVSRVSIRTVTTKGVKPKKGTQKGTEFLPGHGEKIWIFNHFMTGQTVYSHEPVMKATKALRQLPFTQKKLKPSKLRKDYWRPLAMIQFPEGHAAVGRSVFARMRQLKHLHEVAWDDSYFYDNKGKILSVYERGMKLQNQKPNTIADMAAVLGGLGKGNKMWIALPEGTAITAAPAPAMTEEPSAQSKETAEAATTETQAEAKTEPTAEKAKPVEVEVKEEDPSVIYAGEEIVQMDAATGQQMGLLKAQVWWTDAMDLNYATKWPANVEHHTFNEHLLEQVRAPETEAAESDEAKVDDVTSPTAPADVVADSELSKTDPKDSQPRQ